MIGAVILACEPPALRNNGEQLELLSPTFQLESAIKPFLQLSLQQVILVLGRDYHRILNMLGELPPHVKMLIHRRPERGLGSALSAGLQALPLEVRGIMVAPADRVVEHKVLEKLLTVFRQEDLKEKSKKRIIVSLNRGKRGFPWVVSSDLRKELSRLDGQPALEDFLKNHKKDVFPVAADGA